MSLKKRGNAKNFFRKFWNLLWKDDSFKGWLFSIIFIFVVIKFIFFPLLSLATGTQLPLVIVESCSMYHNGAVLSNFNAWWLSHEDKYAKMNITKEEYEEFDLKNGFNKGDILFVVKAKPEKIKVGDVIIFNANQKNPIIHRIIEVKGKNGERIFSTIGDNNKGQLSFETEINENTLEGKAIVKIAPYLGWVKLVFFDWQKPESERGFCREN